MRNVVVAACAGVAVLLACIGGARGSFAFQDVALWAGAGANEAVLIIDWNDGKVSESIAWGYRWDGATTGADMMEAVVRADPRLFGAIAQLGFGIATIGFGYDLDGDGFQTSPATAFDGDGYAVIGTRDGTVSADADDHYVEGWNAGYWAYYVAAESPFGGGGAWGYADNGLGAQVVGDGEWHGLSFAPGFNGPTPDEPVAAAVPTPGTCVCLGAAGVGVVRRRRR